MAAVLVDLNIIGYTLIQSQTAFGTDSTIKTLFKILIIIFHSLSGIVSKINID